MTTTSTIGRLTAAGAAVAVAGLSLGAAAPAQAAGQSGYGTVGADGGLTIHRAPTTHVDNHQGALGDGQQVYVVCQASGTPITERGQKPDARWFLVSLGTGSSGWVSGHYVKTDAQPPLCSTTQGATTSGRVSTAVRLRGGPSAADPQTGTSYSGDTVKLACSVTAQKVDGNSTWYLTGDNRWVAARYVRNVGAAPAACA